MTKNHEKGWSWKSPALCLVLMPCWCLSATACFHIPATGQASFPKEQLWGRCSMLPLQWDSTHSYEGEQFQVQGLSAFGNAKTGFFCCMGDINGTQVTATVSLLRLALHSLDCAEVLIHYKPQSRCRCCRVHQKWVGIFCKPGKTLASLALTYLAEKNSVLKWN